ncbi:cation-translocating P-type ATPase [Roseateles oligotrophus]|uniref:Cation-translocating P-type ATPase n=1 Tax=Roseateles oligotrophus TaxID=1769250 RepID=A0ABT2YCV7_9BURK|nr:cation-translocating P-type ATPase [Roseateles oligotrophus]MCV2367872.1 cation-translocating P-type ATPase [Roseateles oligotrophus]
MNHDDARDPDKGLSQAQAAKRLNEDGPNELSPPRRRTIWHILADLVREPMLQLLLAAGAIYLLLGDRGEALMLLGFVLLTVIISVSQEQRTERVLEALRDLTSPRALVIRDGEPERIAGREVVRGDLLMLTEGDRVAADALLLQANDLQCDESLLSGESLPVAKRPWVAGESAAEPHRVFAGSLVVGGQGRARVTATGPRSEIGRIGKSLAEIAAPATPLHRQTRRLVRVFSVLGLSLSAALVLIYGLLRGDWLAGLLAGITLAMSMLPQEFLLILTVFMAMGAWRLSTQRVLSRRSATIETLGSATVLCTDKTGTLTVNKMAVAELCIASGAGVELWPAEAQTLPPQFHALLEFAVLASERDPFDPMERALVELGQAHLPASARHPGWTLLHEYALSPTLPAMTHVWQADGAEQVVAIKGAVEAVLALCRLPAAQALALTQRTEAMAARGLRVLAVARAKWDKGAGEPWPADPAGFEFELLGLCAFADPLRPEVPAAIAECRAAGLRVLMVTGDHPATAIAIAAQAGLADSEAALTGSAMALINAAELDRQLRTQHVFARIKPAQKLALVEALKAQGEIVAMTGDGVNDAPSLKAAHIGIAMGGRGTDVAREASSLVLLDDNFAAIVQAVRLGRRIFDNLRKAMAFVLAVHVPIAGLSLLPLLLGWPLILSPVHIAFLELLIDPVCSVVFEAEPEEADVMARPPRDPAAPLFSSGLLGWSLLQGGLILVAVGGWFAGLLAYGLAPEQARALAFVALVACDIALILANRSFSGPLLAAWLRPNRMLGWMLAATALLLALALGLAPLREVFGFELPPTGLLAASLALGSVVLLMLEALKRLFRQLVMGAATAGLASKRDTASLTLPPSSSSA